MWEVKFKKSFGILQMMTNNKTLLGEKGELNAKEYLIKKGYTILFTNFRYKKLEADIIALDKNCLVFVEVKTRSLNKFGNPEKFVDKRKINNIKQLAQNFLIEFPVYSLIRFDVIAILQNNIEHFEDAF